MHARSHACSFKGVDIALFSAGGSISKTLGPVAAAAGCIVSPDKQQGAQPCASTKHEHPKTQLRSSTADSLRMLLLVRLRISPVKTTYSLFYSSSDAVQSLTMFDWWSGRWWTTPPPSAWRRMCPWSSLR